jgi:cation:H+ antiporter
MMQIVLSQFVVNLLILGISLIVLNLASSLTINNAIKVSDITRLGKTSVGFSLLAFSTSLPELTVALIAALSGGAPLSVGNVLGSNIVNICVVVGLSAILLYLVRPKSNANAAKWQKRVANVIPSFAKSELSTIHFGLFISSIVPLILIYVAQATWVVGLILISVFVAYMYQLSKIRIPPEGNGTPYEDKSKLRRYTFLTILGALSVVASGYFLVESVVSIARSAGIPQTVIGATIVAFGTSLPEIIIGLGAILKGHPALAFGDIIGSSFINITFILGISFFVPTLVGSPLRFLNMGAFQNIMIFSIITNLFFWYFLSREKIGLSEGAIFLFIYVLFITTTVSAF